MQCQGDVPGVYLQDTLKTWPRPASRPVSGLTFSLCANHLFPTA